MNDPRRQICACVAACIALFIGSSARAEVQVTVERNEGEHATRDFAFKNVPRPAQADAATNAKFTLVDGTRDRSGGRLDVLHDGKGPSEEDQPGGNFFFNPGAD